MPAWLIDIIYLLSRWLHIVLMTLIVGGTLFFELVLPIAIEDLKREEKLYVFARARLVFRWVVWISTVGLLITGMVCLQRMWSLYTEAEFHYVWRWALSHLLIGVITLGIALLLTIGRRPPEDPVRWMRLNLVILLIAIFLGSATRHFQLALRERQFERAGKVPTTQPVEVQLPAATQPSGG